MPRSPSLAAKAAARSAVVLLFILSGCADAPGDGFAPDVVVDDDRVDADGPRNPDGTPAAVVADKAGLDNPPIAVDPFFNGAFPTRTPNSPGSSTWDVVAAFPALDLGDTLVITSNPDNDRIYVATRDGFIRSFDNDPDVSSAETFLDLRDRTAVVWDGGYLGLVFHPEFGDPGSPFRNYVYAFYTTHCPLDASRDQPDLGNCFDAYPRNSTGGYFNTYIRISRFEVPDGATAADINSEQVMLNIRLYNGSHRGGGMVFRNDGYLHVTIGDQFRYETAQDIVDTLEGGSIRIAVDVTDNGDGTWSCPAGSHLPRRIFDTTDEISGQWYCIPDDNPWLDVGGGQFEEYCSIGHRNPHRLAWDPVTDFMWSGEIGQSTREEINVIFCGNNYGWPFREGLTSGVRQEPSSFIGTLTDPVIDFVRSEARAIIGGYVYRGSLYPELYGRYLAGDYVTGNIWAITLDESTMTATKEFLTVFDPGGLGTWGQDKLGEIYLGDVINGGPLYTLERIGDPVPDAPGLLSDVGAFTDLPNLTPDSGWVPYGLNQPFWSDGAAKSRWVAVPNDGSRDTSDEQVTFSENGDWGFPIGTVLMKHFELPVDEDDPSITDRLETRFFVHGDDGKWYGLSYRWRPDRSDADLLVTDDTSLHTIALSGGGTRVQTWNYPSRLQCNTCHRASGVLGPRTHQLNGDLLYPSTGRTDNQLATWNHLGMFSPALVEVDIPTMIRSKSLEDVTASLEDRARSWLASNCAGCHRPGEVTAGFDLRYETPFISQGLVWTGVRDDLGNPGTVVIRPGDPELSSLFKRVEAIGPIAMPPLAKELAELPAVDLLREWILRIDDSFPQQGVAYEYWETGQLSQLPDFDALGTPDKASTVSTIDISVRDRDNDFAFRFRGFLEITTGGNYTFFTTSDDGSKLFIDDVEVVDNDGLHGPTEENSGPINLAPGYYAIEVTMFERGGGQVLSASYSGPDTGNVQVPLAPLFLQIPNPIPNDPPTLDAPADQVSSIGAVASLALIGDDPNADSLYYDAAGLPLGLAIDHQSGEISGTIDADAPTGTLTVTASASDGPEVAVVEFDWTLVGSVCGDGNVEAGEECDDGNTIDGDGCSSVCTIESAQVCGDGTVTAPEQCEPPNTDVCTATCTDRAPLCDDGFLTPPEACEPPNTATCDSNCQVRVPSCGDGFLTPPEVCEPPNTDTCNALCATRIASCGDGFLTPPETCEDGNSVGGDGCSAICQIEGGGAGEDLTDDGTIIASVLQSLGGGGDINRIRDDDFPPVGTADFSRQYDSWDGANTADIDFVGYEYTSDQVFGRVVFQEGRHFFDGGWFESFTVEVRQGGVWTEVSGLLVDPPYPGNNGINYEIFELTFSPIVGDAIRIVGPPGGGADFISVGELEVYAADLGGPSCGDGTLDVDNGEECDDGNNAAGDGCSPSCAAEFCGDGEVNNMTETCDPPGTATCNDSCTSRVPVCGDGFVTPPETCEDGNLVDGDGCTATCQIEANPTGADLTDDGTIIALVIQSLGGGGNINRIRDDDIPPVGSADFSRQYDSWDGANTSPEDWVGYAYTSDQVFGRVVFQEGRHFFDGGWFDSLTVQVRQDGVWNEVSGLTTTPSYPGNNGVNFETFELTFLPIVGDAIRIYGDPGGAADFISIGELEVYEASGTGSTCGDGTVDAGEDCDDGNTSSGDGCSSSCVTETCGDGIVNNSTETCEPPGTATCNDSCTDRVPLCGDGFVTGPETCDDGNTVDGDGCSASCQTEIVAFCGDGVITAPETCEPPGTATCNDTCTARVPDCGDGFVTSPEECDDGNTIDGDGCSALCETEIPAVCGDGVITAPETCEPPGTATCTDTCTDRAPSCGDGFVTAPETCEPPGTATCNDTCTARVADCGDGFVTSPEECDDGNTIDGDGCSALCETEIPAVCGDGVITAPETCEPPGTATCTDTCTDRAPSCGDGFVTAPEACEPPGTAVCDDNCAARVAVCGDGLITPPESCDDSNTVGGDGCSAICEVEAPGADLTDTGTIIAKVLQSLGGGGDINRIRDNDLPPVGSLDFSRQYDSWDGANTSPDDFIGYEYTSDQVFGRVVFQEGRHFFDGGWFDSLTVEVRQGGVWSEVNGLSIIPSYPGNNGVNFEVFDLTFAPAVGDAIRIVGDPGGGADFISVGELEVYAPGEVTCGNGEIDGAEQCDDGGAVDGDGCSATCRLEVCGDGVVNNAGAEDCEPPGTALCNVDCTTRVALCGDGFVTPPESCDDGNPTDGDGCSSICELEAAPLKTIGTIVAAVPNSLGGGGNIETIRDGDFPPVGSADFTRHYDSWDGANTAAEDWIGYTFASDYSFGRVVYQEGRQFFDGGWFEPGTLRVEVRQGGVWVEATGLVISPAYPANNGVNFETFNLFFDPTVGDGIRIIGAPGGGADFISVGELEVFESP